MSPPLHRSLIAVVLVNLCFVAITGAVAPGALLAMAAATLLSPWLRRWVGRWWYHGAWNAIVIGVFTMLVQHVSSGGLHLLLEDGLRLAALCQVHLVSSLSREHRRDLLFFNSFLIPVVTSFLCTDTAFSLALLAYTPVVSVALHLSVLEGSAGHEHAWRRSVTQGALRGGVVLVGGFLVFFLMPRDFEHRGLLKTRFEWDHARSFLAVDFQEEIQLGESGPAQQSREPVFHVYALDPGGPIPAYWRGATTDRFTGRGWVASGRPVPDWPWSPAWSGPISRGHGRVDRRLRVVGKAPIRRAFAPLEAVELNAEDLASLRAHGDGTLELSRRLSSYELGLGEPLGPAGGFDATAHATLREIRPGTVSDAVRDALLTLGGGPEDQTLAETVELLSDRLRARSHYLAPGDPQAATTLDEFVLDDRGGHCEWYATALALALRLHDVPCRVVTGYRSEELGRDGPYLIVRRSHAHAWVEYLDPQRGWRLADATPTADLGQLAGGGSWWARLRGHLDAWWVSVTGFDEQVREQLWSRTTAVLWRLVRSPACVTAVLGLLVLWLAWRQSWRQRLVPATVRALRAAARAAGTQWRPEETPRELLARLEGMPCRPRTRQRVEHAVRALENERYA